MATPIIAPSESVPHIVVVSGNDGRVSRDEEIALNALLRRDGGEFQGKPFYKIAWAADDNSGLARNHVCGRQDPFDWSNCECPRRPELQTPLCFHPDQNCYHLLGWEAPVEQTSEVVAAARELHEDLSRGTYACLLHFVDPVTHAPLPVRQQLIEIILPVLKEMTEIARATLYQCNATRARLRNAKNSEIESQERLRLTKWQSAAESILSEALPIMTPYSSGRGPKHRQFSEMTAEEMQRERLAKQVQEATDLPTTESNFVFSARPARPRNG